MKNKYIALLILPLFIFSGCASIQKVKDYDRLKAENAELRGQIDQMKEKTDKKLTDLEIAKRDLEESLKKEIGDYQAKLKMTERGLVITFLSEVFFDSGRDVVKPNGRSALDRVAEVLNKDVSTSFVAIEGHTDNDPIKHSSWKSNWELSAARSLAVLHYLIDEDKIDPKRLSAVGYGEFRPVELNDTIEHKQKNRRVEIVILPSAMSRVKSLNKEVNL